MSVRVNAAAAIHRADAATRREKPGSLRCTTAPTMSSTRPSTFQRGSGVASCAVNRCAALSRAGSSSSRKTGLAKAVKHVSEPTRSPIQAVVAIFSNGTVSRKGHYLVTGPSQGKDIIRSKALKIVGYPEVDRFGSWTVSSFLNRRRRELSDHSGTVEQSLLRASATPAP